MKFSFLLGAWLAGLGWVTQSPGEVEHHESLDPGADVVTPTPLRTLDTVPFPETGFLAWQGPVRCDEEGDLYFLLAPHLPPDAAAQELPEPTVVLRVSADGKEATRYDTAAIPSFADADGIRADSLALGPDGTPSILVWVRRGEGGSQYVVSLDDRGRDRSRVKIDGEEIGVGRIEVFGSGDFLLHGHRTRWMGERLAVMPAGGGGLRDVIGLARDEGEDPEASLRGPHHFAPGGDGRIYFTAQGEDAVHVIHPSGDADYAFNLAPMPRDLRVAGLMASGSRLAVSYYEDGTSEGGRFWLAVYDVALAERVGVYGPTPGVPTCYTYVRSRDRFTLLKGGQLVTAAP